MTNEDARRVIDLLLQREANDIEPSGHVKMSDRGEVVVEFGNGWESRFYHCGTGTLSLDLRTVKGKDFVEFLENCMKLRRNGIDVVCTVPRPWNQRFSNASLHEWCTVSLFSHFSSLDEMQIWFDMVDDSL